MAQQCSGGCLRSAAATVSTLWRSEIARGHGAAQRFIDLRCNLKQFEFRGRPRVHFSFSAVNENADENEVPFSAEKRKRKSPAYITELSYGSVANITFSAQRK